MKAIRAACLLVVAGCGLPHVHGSEVSRYDGMCDASAAVALDRDHFVVADDERNTLLVYRRGQPAAAASIDLAPFLGTAPDKESDLEGAAVIGQRIYWIASHARNSTGKLREERHRFFATDIDTRSVPPSLTPVGTPYTRLLADLIAADALQGLQLGEAAQRAPESPGGLNIEGLAATPDGKLLIAFRNPIPRGKALLVPLDNPQAVVTGQAAKFGVPVSLDLGGRGIRSIEWTGAAYLIVAGPAADSGSFALFRWNGKAADAPALVKGVDLNGLRPEAMFAMPATNQLQFLSDDGGVVTEGVACKDRDAARRSFRSITVKKPEPAR